MKIICYAVIFCSLVSGILTSSAKAQDIVVRDGYVRETIPGTKVSSAYMTVKNNSEKVLTLTGASSDVSKRIEIHEHIMADGMMRMQQRQSLIIKAHGEVVLQPSGFHLMIFDLEQSLKHKDTISVTLHFSDQDDLIIQLPVQSIKKMQNHHH